MKDFLVKLHLHVYRGTSKEWPVDRKLMQWLSGYNNKHKRWRQHEPADPHMTVPDHAGLETPSQFTATLNSTRSGRRCQWRVARASAMKS